MMAAFGNLHDAGRALASHIRRNVTPVLSDVLAGPPIENAASPGEAIRVTLMWVTPQPTHRNDAWGIGEDGQLHPPPVTLSGFYVVTAYGTAGTGESTQAINRLGQALQVIETAPVIEMPLADDPNTSTVDPVPGEGRMSAVLVPVAADLMEKIFTPLQMRHRPWALVELGPIQLVRLEAPEPGPDVVAPGGVRLEGPRPITRPAIFGLSPARLGRGRRLRLDTLEAAGAGRLRLGEEVFVFADAPSAADEIARPDAEGRIFATYPSGAATGEIKAALLGASGNSDPAPLSVLPEGAPALDAPAASLAPGEDLVLTGAGLGDVDRVYLWPDRGVQEPAEVIERAPDVLSATEIRLDRAALDTAGLRAMRYRATARTGPNRFLPFVLVEVAR
jgi:hypothetical protein